MSHQTIEEYFEENFFVILPTGKVNFNWPSQSNADGYFAKINKNGLPFNTYNTTGLSIEVSGFKEGDVVDGLVFPHVNNNPYSTPYSLTPQSIPVTNFNEEFNFYALDEAHAVVASVEGGESFRMSGVKIDSIPIDTVSTSSGVFGTGHYEGGSAKIDYLISNPRQLHLRYLTDFSEPFLSGIYYNAIGNLESSSSAVSDFSFDFNNTLDSRNIELTLVAQDVYSGGVTGHFSLLNEPAKILSSNHSLLTNPNKQSGVFNFFPTYSGTVNEVRYELKTAGGVSLFSGQSNNPFQASGGFPYDQTGFLHITPYDWFGSGSTFVSSNPIFYSSENFIPKNKIKNFQVESNQGSFSVFADYQQNNSSGSYFELSVNSSTGVIYPQESSYFSGQFDDFQNEYVFDHFTNRTGTHEDFYFNLNLYRSGSNTLEDSAEEFSFAKLPQFTKTGINFNYNKGTTKVDFESTPKFNFTGVDILLRDFNDPSQSSAEIYSGFNKIFSEDNVNLQVSLVESGNHSNVFETLNFVASGQKPLLIASKNTAEYLDGKNVFSFINNKTFMPISSVNVYRKKGFQIVSGNFPESFSGLSNFSDYEDHFYRSVPFDFYSDNAPDNISRNLNYSVINYETGSYITGYYESGRDYFYKFEPINNFNVTGEISPSIVHRFSQNTIGSNTESDLVTTESNVSQATDNISNIESNIVVVESDINSVQSNISDISGNAFFITGSQVVSGDKHFSGKFMLGNNQIPTSPTDTGISGQLSWDSSYFYICTGNNAWGRIQFDTWSS